MEKTSNQVVRSADIIGKNVLGANKDKLGKIEEIVLDKVSGQVRYAVLSFGGFIGMGTDFYPLPWKSLSFCTSHDAFETQLTEDKLKSAKGFDKDNWPDFADETYSRSVNDYYAM